MVHSHIANSKWGVCNATILCKDQSFGLSQSVYVKVCLLYLYPKLQPGGWIIFDEYFSPRYPGARLAVDDFFADKLETPSLDTDLLREDAYERWFLIKEG